MPILDSYRKSAFLQNESGRHLDAWRSVSYWKSVQSQSGANKPPRGWSHYVLEPPERALDYLDWLNHRHPNKPYLIRRLLHPTWLLASILEEVAAQQLSRIIDCNRPQNVAVSQYANQSKTWKREIQFLLERSSWTLSLMRAIRLNSEWLRAREKLIQATIESSDRAAGSVPEPVEARSRPWDRPGVGTWQARDFLKQFLEKQERADKELFMVLTDFEAQPEQIQVPLLDPPLPNANPRIDRYHYLFGNASIAIDYLKWLNHRHPNWPYLLRRALLPVRELTRMVEAIATHQMAVVENSQPWVSNAPTAYLAEAERWSSAIQSCVNKSAGAIPMMRAIRLNCEWLRGRQDLIDKTGRSPAVNQGPVEVRVVPWRHSDGKEKSHDDVLRELLALQLAADKQLRPVPAKTQS